MRTSLSGTARDVKGGPEGVGVAEEEEEAGVAAGVVGLEAEGEGDRALQHCTNHMS